MSGDLEILQQYVRTACRLEVSAVKPGNVTPGQEFDNATVADFLKSADVIAPVLANTAAQGIGPTVYEAVRRTRAATGHNTNLGIVLLLTPLCHVPLNQTLTAGLPQVLQHLTVADAGWTYSAIVLAEPGGIGEAPDQDVRQAPDRNLRECMCLAADRDQIARQYCHGFPEVLVTGRQWLEEACREYGDTDLLPITALALKLLAEFPDSLIARKCGSELAATVQQRAAAVLAAGWPQTESGRQQFDQFDTFLRADGNRRNPGTTADLVAAILFAGLRDGWYRAPQSFSEP